MKGRLVEQFVGKGRDLLLVWVTHTVEPGDKPSLAEPTGIGERRRQRVC